MEAIIESMIVVAPVEGGWGVFSQQLAPEVKRTRLGTRTFTGIEEAAEAASNPARRLLGDS